MGTRELERVELMGRVAKTRLKLVDAAVMLQLSYRQVKRLWRRYQEVGSNGLKHGNAGRRSNRGRPVKLRHRILNLIKKKYSSSEKELRAYFSRRAPGRGRWIVVDHEDIAALDVAGAPMEPAAPPEKALPTQGTEETLR